MSTPSVAPIEYDASSRDTSKLSIYPKDEPVVYLQPDPTRLELEIRRARLAATGQYNQVRTVVRNGVERWIGYEQHVEKRVKSLKSPQEPLTPGVLYAGVAGLTGSVIARGRILPVRVLLPPLLLFGSLPYFLPRTSHNIGLWLSELEHAHLPEVAAQHDRLTSRSREILSTARAHTAMTTQRVRDGTQWAVSETQRLTGLRFREALGWAGRKEEQLVAEGSKVAKQVEKKAVELKDKAKKEGQQAAATTKSEAEKVRKILYFTAVTLEDVPDDDS